MPKAATSRPPAPNGWDSQWRCKSAPSPGPLSTYLVGMVVDAPQAAVFEPLRQRRSRQPAHRSGAHCPGRWRVVACRGGIYSAGGCCPLSLDATEEGAVEPSPMLLPTVTDTPAQEEATPADASEDVTPELTETAMPTDAPATFTPTPDATATSTSTDTPTVRPTATPLPTNTVTQTPAARSLPPRSPWRQAWPKPP